MTKSELVEKIVQEIPDFTKRDIEMMVNAIFESMTEALSTGDKIEIRGFGSFKVKQRKERDGRNPKTGEKINIPPRKIPFFKVGKELRERINS